MLKLEGKCIGVLSYPAKGERPAFHQLQVLVEQPTRSGDLRRDIINMTVQDREKYREGEEVSIKVAAFAKDRITYFCLE